MPSLNSSTRLSIRPLVLIVLAATLLFGVALAVNVVGIQLSGGIAGWQKWLEAHRTHFFVWRLCLYASLLIAWPWVRRFRLQRSPQTKGQLLGIEVLGLASIVITEASQWLRPL